MFDMHGKGPRLHHPLPSQKGHAVQDRQVSALEAPRFQVEEHIVEWHHHRSPPPLPASPHQVMAGDWCSVLTSVALNYAKAGRSRHSWFQIDASYVPSKSDSKAHHSTKVSGKIFVQVV